MATANNMLTSSHVDDAIQTKIADEALGQLIEKATMPRLVNTTYSEKIANKGQTVDVVKIGGLTIKDKAAGYEYEKQTADTTKVSVTLDKHKYIEVGEEDVAANFSEIDTLAKYVTDAVANLSNEVDSDLIALFSAFTTNTVDASSTWARSEMLEAQTLLRKNGKLPRSMEKYLVCAPDALEDLLDNDSVAFADRTGDDSVAIEGYAGKRFGAVLFDDTNIEADGGTPDTYTNLLFVRDAMAIATSNLKITEAPNVFQKMMVDPNSGLAMRYTYYYDTKGGGDTFRVEMLYGVAEIRDEYAVKITTAA